jgi:hypothetical protein
MDQLISEYWGPILAVGILAGFLLAGRRGWKRAEAECGEPGCICGGERTRAYQTMRLDAPQSRPIYIQQPAPIYIQAPQPEIRYLPAQQPIYLQGPQPPQSEPVYLPTPQAQRQARYLQSSQTAYPQDPPIYQPQHHPVQQPMSYYAGPPPIVEGYQPDHAPHQLPPARVVLLPPAPVSPATEVRRRLEDWELEKELQRRRK